MSTSPVDALDFAMPMIRPVGPETTEDFLRLLMQIHSGLIENGCIETAAFIAQLTAHLEGLAARLRETAEQLRSSKLMLVSADRQTRQALELAERVKAESDRSELRHFRLRTAVANALRASESELHG